MSKRLEYYLMTAPRGLASRLRLGAYRALGMKMGRANRMEGGGRVRRCTQIQIGSRNSLTEGVWLWPIDAEYGGIRIRIGDGNYFNRNLMIDACGYVEIGDYNMFGPGVYVTDSNHRFGPELAPCQLPMDVGKVKIGSRCWIGAGVTILKDVELGDGCVVGAGAVVNRSVAPGAIVAGVPAKPLGR